MSRLLRVGEDKIRTWIKSGKLAAINTATNLSGRPRYVILPDSLEAFVKTRTASQPAPTGRRRARAGTIDYYPD